MRIVRAGILPPLFFALLCVGSSLHAQTDVRSAAKRIAELVVHDMPLEPGASVHIDVHAQEEEVQLREGIIEGLLQSGIVVIEVRSGENTDIALSFVSRGKLAGELNLSVLGLDTGEGRYTFSKAYAVPVEETTILESVLAPVIIASAAILVVYLLLTVRSS